VRGEVGQRELATGVVRMGQWKGCVVQQVRPAVCAFKEDREHRGVQEGVRKGLYLGVRPILIVKRRGGRCGRA